MGRNRNKNRNRPKPGSGSAAVAGKQVAKPRAPSGPGPTAQSGQAGVQSHPIWTHALAFGGGATLTIALFTQAVVPTAVERHRLEAEKFKQDAQALPAAKTQIAALKAEVEAERKSVDRERALRKAAEMDAPFLPGNPYPKGLDDVRVGMPRDAIDKAFPAKLLDKSRDGYWSASPEHGLFTRVTYYFEEDKAPDYPITHISFSYSPLNDLPDDFLLKRLTAALGPPSHHLSGTFYDWVPENAPGVFHNMDYAYMVMQEGSAPGYWPEIPSPKK